ncbi:hypothetical protein WNY78_17630 [Psychroserpens sp. AS72]|uniref:hypothetical protein n=1 Tax=Psychroserpens sp. AS72 TaxID=3135775 RepID=UPI0031782D21
MRILKFLFIVLIIFISISSCTPQELDDDNLNLIDNVQATGDENETVDDGSKD